MTNVRISSLVPSFRQIGLFILLTISVIAFSCSQTWAKPKNILYLNSYHVGYKWSDELYQGFLDGIGSKLSGISLHVEYLDMKRNFSEDRYGQLADALASKYKNIPIDLLVSSDDAAFLFLKKYGKSLFPNAPVFFSGTNYMEEKDLEGMDNFYGITEKADIEATFQAIHDLKPETDHVYIINDMTVTGRKVQLQIDEAIEQFKDRFKFTIWNDVSMSDLITRVNSIEENSVVFYTFFFRDSHGLSFEYDQSMNLVYRQCPVPIFGAWDFNLNLGLTGGMLTSGHQQGKAVAELVTKWFQRTPLNTFPRVTSSPNRFMFDYTQLTRFDIKISTLPENSIIINKPIGFLEKHQKILLVSGLFIFILLLVILILAFTIIGRRKAEQELRRSEKNFRSIFDNTNEGLYQSSPEGRFIRVNPALAKMLKFESPDEVVDYFTDITNQLYTSASSRESFLTRQKTSGWAKGEHTLKCKDGSIINVIENVHSVKDDNGKLLFYEGSITDMTEYKKTQELITQTEKLMSLGGVSAGIAHEIRSPLSSIIQGIQIIQGRIFENNQQNLNAAKEADIPLEGIRSYLEKREVSELLTHILDSGKRVGVIIEDMLSFSRKSIGDFSMESLADILESSLEMAAKDYTLKTEYKFRDLAIVREFDEDVPKIMCSASKMRQVFFNIIKNSAESMGNHSTSTPQLTLRLKNAEDLVRIEIEDNGPGIDDELRRKIFEPFYTTKEREEGTGLGLSVSYFIVKENHHGDLRVTSPPGKGATFIIDLPIKQVTPGIDEM